MYHISFVFGTKLHTNAFKAGAVQYKAHRTFAAERSVGVDTFTTITNTWHDTAFVKIFSLWTTTGSAWAKFLKLG